MQVDRIVGGVEFDSEKLRAAMLPALLAEDLLRSDPIAEDVTPKEAVEWFKRNTFAFVKPLYTLRWFCEMTNESRFEVAGFCLTYGQEIHAGRLNRVLARVSKFLAFSGESIESYCGFDKSELRELDDWSDPMGNDFYRVARIKHRLKCAAEVGIDYAPARCAPVQ